MIVLSSIVGSLLIFASGAVVWAFLRFVKTFGEYTESHRQLTTALLTTHESSLLLHRAQVATLEIHQAILEELRSFKQSQVKEVA